MPADIVLQEESVDIVDGRLQVHTTLLGMGEDGGRWLRALLEEPKARTPKGTAFLEVGSGTQSSATIRLIAEDGSTSITSKGIDAEEVRGRDRVHSWRGEFGEVVADEFNVGSGLSYAEEPRAGVVKVKSATGEASIVLDGASGDIVLGAIGSLVEKIQELQRQIDELRA